ncbi:MAG: polysaccharide biosynthesis protein, partial [Planctomycetota bacterium]
DGFARGVNNSDSISAVLGELQMTDGAVRQSISQVDSGMIGGRTTLVAADSSPVAPSSAYMSNCQSAVTSGAGTSTSVPGAPASLIDGGTADALTRATSVRFANVAFSDGSLPWGFLQRLEKRQPLAGPSDIRRYLVSPREAGQLCLLAALGAPHRHVLIPELDPKRDTVTFRAIADAVLAERGLRPVEYSDAAAARAAVDRDIANGGWPVVFLPSDTSGEKDIEVFAAPNEATTACGLPGCLAIPGLSPNQQALSELLTLIDGCCRLGQPVPDKPTLTNAMSLVVRELRHHEAGRSLDSKM